MAYLLMNVMLMLQKVSTEDQALSFITYNDVYVMEQTVSRGHGRGGASRASRLFSTLKARDPNALVLFAGDTISPSLWSVTFKGVQMAHMHNTLGTSLISV